MVFGGVVSAIIRERVRLHGVCVLHFSLADGVGEACDPRLWVERMAAASPNCLMLRGARMAAFVTAILRRVWAGRRYHPLGSCDTP